MERNLTNESGSQKQQLAIAPIAPIAAVGATGDLPRLNALEQGLVAGLTISGAKDILVQLYVGRSLPKTYETICSRAAYRSIFP